MNSMLDDDADDLENDLNSNYFHIARSETEDNVSKKTCSNGITGSAACGF